MSKQKRRRKYDGCIFKRGRMWYVRWVYDGRAFMKSLGTGDRREAEAKSQTMLAEFQARNRAEVLSNIAARLGDTKRELAELADKRPALKLADAFEAYRKHPNRPQAGERTLAGYEGQFARFTAWIAAHYPHAVEMRHVSADMAHEFLADLEQAASPNTYNKYLSFLALVWRVLYGAARCVEMPWRDTRKKVLPKSNGRRELSADELRRVFAGLSGEMRLLFALGIYTGLRLGDCALLDWPSVDLSAGRIVTTPRKTSKTGRAVSIPLHGALAEMLQSIPERDRHGRIMPEIARQYRKNAAGLCARIRGAFENAGISTSRDVAGYARAAAIVGFHSLRHSFVSLMGNAGAPLALVQAIVGHTNQQMTAHYFHAGTDALKCAVENLPTLMEPTGEIDPASEREKRPLERTEQKGDNDAPESGGARLRAFKAAFLALSADERETARQWMTERPS